MIKIIIFLQLFLVALYT
jgi:hypothetical protein